MKVSVVRNMVHAIIMGPPGSGKGTISSRIIRDFRIKHLSSGDLFRAEIAGKTKCGLQAQGFIEAGKLVPDKIVVDLLLAQINKISANWILDGFPRTLEQAKILSEHENIDAVVNLDVPFDVIKERLSGRWTHAPSGRVYNEGFNPPKNPQIDDVTGDKLIQREDDKPETVVKRLETYLNQTTPLLEFYRKQGLLSNYSGEKTDVIWPQVYNFLETLLPKQNQAASV